MGRAARSKERGKDQRRIPEGEYPSEPVVPAEQLLPFGALRRLLLALLPLLLLMVYAETLNHPFVFDDTSNILKNPHIQLQEFSLAGLRAAVTGGPSLNRPVANLSFALNYLAGEYDPPLYRLVNILIHGANALLLFLFLRQTLWLSAGAEVPVAMHERTAYLVALLWLVHPLHIQSVTYIVQRMNSLAALFYLSTMIFYVRARQAAAGGWARRLFGAGAVVCALLALGSKENAIALPFMLWIYEILFFQEGGWRQLRINLLVTALGFALGLLILGAFSFLYLGSSPWESIQAAYAGRDFTMGQRFMTQWRVVVFYISLFLWPTPHRLTLLHDFPLSTSLLSPPTTLASLLVLVGATLAAILLARRHRLLSFSLFWFLGNLVLESSFVGLEIIFEHRTYLPSMFLTLLLVLGLQRLTQDWKRQLTVAALLVGLLGFWTYQRNQVWGDKVGFWLDCLQKCPNEVRIHNNLGQALEEKGRYDEAIDHYRQAIAQDEMYARAYNNLGLALEKTGRGEEAEKVYHHLLSFAPTDADAHYNLGSYLGKTDRALDALEYLEKSHKLQHPDADADVHNNMGIILAMYGRLEEATGHFIEALRIKPRDYLTHNNLGLAYAQMGEYDKAERHFRECLRLQPDFADARRNLDYLQSRIVGQD
jgi:tetratricopeptide (TPR) repeat protein